MLRVREGIRDIGPDGSLAREVKRGDRALPYHTFALLPLVFAAELVQRRNIDLYRENDGAIGRLANLVIDAVGDPASFRKITPIRQDLFPWMFRDERSWVEPYYARFHDRRLPAIIAPRDRAARHRRFERDTTSIHTASTSTAPLTIICQYASTSSIDIPLSRLAITSAPISAP